MSLRVKIMMSAVLAACVMLVILIMSVYGLAAVSALAKEGASSQEIVDYCAMLRRFLLLIGVGGFWLTFVVACVVAVGVHRRLLMVVVNTVECGEQLAYTATDDTEELSELVSAQANAAMAVTEELVAIIEGKPVRGRVCPDGMPTTDRPRTLSARDIIPLGDDDDF